MSFETTTKPRKNRLAPLKLACELPYKEDAIARKERRRPLTIVFVGFLSSGFGVVQGLSYLCEICKKEEEEGVDEKGWCSTKILNDCQAFYNPEIEYFQKLHKSIFIPGMFT